MQFPSPYHLAHSDTEKSPISADTGRHVSKKFPLINLHNFGPYIENAFLTGFNAGNRYSGAYFSGVISGKKNQFKNESKAEVCYLGHLTAIAAASGIIAYTGANNRDPLLTTCLLVAMTFNRINTGCNVIAVSTLFTPINNRLVVIIVYTAYIVSLASVIDGKIGKKFGKLSVVKKMSGVACGILNASKAAISWSWDNLKHKVSGPSNMPQT